MKAVRISLSSIPVHKEICESPCSLFPRKFFAESTTSKINSYSKGGVAPIFLLSVYDFKIDFDIKDEPSRGKGNRSLFTSSTRKICRRRWSSFLDPRHPASLDKYYY